MQGWHPAPLPFRQAQRKRYISVLVQTKQPGMLIVDCRLPGIHESFDGRVTRRALNQRPFLAGSLRLLGDDMHHGYCDLIAARRPRS
jgi:hypothetical protein